jgi:Mrp family chromosome partitioning ATPase
MMYARPSSAERPVASVSFVPVQATAVPAAHGAVTFPGLPLVSRLLQELDEPLTRLARQARRAGPLGSAAVVLLAGCRAGVGCSTVALALAAAAARERPVLLLDAHLERAGLSGWLRQPPELGWEDAVGGRCSLEQAVLYPAGPGVLPFLPLRQPVADPGGFLRQPALRAWFVGLRRDHGLLLLDGGPVATLPAEWAHLVDGAFLVGVGGADAAAEWSEARDVLEERGLTVLGVVETLVEG